MQYAVEVRGLTKRFGSLVALDEVELEVRPRSITGLLGRNGSGKTTLLRHLVGLYLPAAGEVTTLGARSSELGHRELGRIGFVPQEIRLLDWMTVWEHLDYVASFYPVWDREREGRLLTELELDRDVRVGALSTGNLQKLAVILSVCHHPELLILDEPVSDLDPIVRARLLEFLLELLREDATTILVSSHVLRDVERIVDWVVCLDRGRVVADAALDDLRETYAEWRVASRDGELPSRFAEPFVLEQEVSGCEARLLVRQGEPEMEAFCLAHDVAVESRPLNLERMFPLLIGERGL